MTPPKIHFTRHAAERARQHGICLATIFAVLANGERIPARGGASKYRLFGFVVVVGGDRILTVYEARGESAPGRRKARSKRRYANRKQERKDRRQ